MIKFINFLRDKSLDAAELLALEYAIHRAKFACLLDDKIGYQALEVARFAILLTGSIFLGILLVAITL